MNKYNELPNRNKPSTDLTKKEFALINVINGLIANDRNRERHPESLLHDAFLVVDELFWHLDRIEEGVLDEALEQRYDLRYQSISNVKNLKFFF